VRSGFVVVVGAAWLWGGWNVVQLQSRCDSGQKPFAAGWPCRPGFDFTFRSTSSRAVSQVSRIRTDGGAKRRPAAVRHPGIAWRFLASSLGHLPHQRSLTLRQPPACLLLSGCHGDRLSSGSRARWSSCHLPAAAARRAFLLRPRGQPLQEGEAEALPLPKPETVCWPRRLADYIGRGNSKEVLRHRRGSHRQPRRALDTCCSTGPWPRKPHGLGDRRGAGVRCGNHQLRRPWSAPAHRRPADQHCRTRAADIID